MELGTWCSERAELALKSCRCARLRDKVLAKQAVYRCPNMFCFLTLNLFLINNKSSQMKLRTPVSTIFGLMKRFARNTDSRKRLADRSGHWGQLACPVRGHEASRTLQAWLKHFKSLKLDRFGIEYWRPNPGDFDFSFTSWGKLKSKHFYSAAHTGFTCKPQRLGSGFSLHCNDNLTFACAAVRPQFCFG